MTEPTRPLWQIELQMKALRAERKAAKPSRAFAPGVKRPRSFKPEGPGQRQPRERDNGHLKFIRRLPCACCCIEGRSDAAHLRMADPTRGKRYTGKAEKPSDRWTTPLCRDCHTRQHSGAEAAFWAALGIDPVDLCIRLYAVTGDEARARQILSKANDDAPEGEGRAAHG